jgi:hypothetical protein
MPEKQPEVYYVEIPLEPHTVTFTTDVESISFAVTPGSQHEFVIRLDDGVESRTLVRASFKKLLSYSRARTASADAVDTIPFTLGDNDKIYVKGRVNGGPELDFQFDLGAGGSVMKKSSVSKVNMTFDGTVTLRNSDGVNEVPLSSANRIEMAGLRWDGVAFAVADNMTHREDALVGNGLFADKVVEIDYDRMAIAVRDSLPVLSADWSREEMFLDGGTVPHVRGRLVVGDESRQGWYLLDTGAYTSILHSDKLSGVSKFAGEFRGLLGPLGGRRSGPTVTIAGQAFSKINYSVRTFDGDASALGIVGNDILKRANLIIDNRRGFAYFRPNGHVGDGFRNPERLVARMVAVVVAAVVAWLVVRGQTTRDRRLTA